jgi:EAL domain-containing protein (putative c-di-GMP-specific phosphodiesterase class I)/AmiR/NasT family two-component response regulator
MSILVVDDDPIMVEVVSMVLRNLGLTSIDTAADGAAALERLNSSTTDLLVCDLNMPGMDGIRLLSHVASLPARPAIILLSGEDQRILETARQFAETKELQILGAIAKPVTSDALIGVLQAFRGTEKRTSIDLRAAVDCRTVLLGLTNHAINLAYQPKVDLADGRLIGVEALLRWDNMEGGSVPPPEIVRAAEECRLIDELTIGVLACAVRDRVALAREGFDTNIALNVSMHNLHNLDMVDRMSELVLGAGDQPNHFTLEVTETHLIEDLGAVLEALLRLRLQGFKIAIDDYGTGAATMQFLMQMPSTELKIDRSFVTAATRSESARALLQSAIEVGAQLGQDVVAEGVETAGEAQLLRQLGCRFAQGYFYGRPMTLDAFTRWLALHRVAPPERIK